MRDAARIEVRTVSTVTSGLVKWWEERGYSSNPFAWSNAADVSEEIFPERFQLWHIDPNAGVDLKGLGPTPTLDGVMSLETNRLVLIYAPAGSGKTFYRRWAARLIEEHWDSQYALEISNVTNQIPNPDSVTTRDLALCVYKRVCERFCTQEIPPPAQSAEYIFEQCDEVIRRSLSNSQAPKRVYVFVDDIDQLFDERPSRAKRNAQAMEAIVDFCRVAARRGERKLLALRMFIPAQLRKPIQKRLGKWRRRIHEYTISWSADYCEAIVERRLDSSWKDGPGTGIIHVSRLFTPDALYEFRKWLQRQKGISPRFVIDVLDRLGYYAYSRGVTTDLINVELWREFVKSSEPKVLRAMDAVYPLSRSLLRLPRWLWPLLLLTLPC